MRQKLLGFALVLALVLAAQAVVGGASSFAQTQQRSGSAGVEGTIPADPPTQAPSITTPTNGQRFTEIPITVAGICQSNLLIEIFKNNVFAGAVQCANGSFSLQVDLFSGRNDLVARAYDALNQASPSSNTVTVTYTERLAGAAQVTITTAYAKRGAEPSETLNWPITISGGRPPYAVSVDWGDKSTPDLLSRRVAGNLTLKHVYQQSGVYHVIIKATDADGSTAYLQVVGIGNGPIQQSLGTQPAAASPSNKLPIILLLVVFPLLLLAFWLGQKHRLQVIRARLHRGLRPF